MTQRKERHIVVTGCLILAVMFSLFGIVLSLFPQIIFNQPPVKNTLLVTANYNLFIDFIGQVIGFVSLLFLFRWKKNALGVLLITKIVVFVTNFIYNLTNMGISDAMANIISIPQFFSHIMLLYIVFQIKKNGVRAWDYLE